MVFLVFETVVLIAAAVACGIFLGIVAKQLFGKVIVVAGGPRFTEIMDQAAADERGAAEASTIDAVVAEVAAEADVVAPDLERAEAADRVGARPPLLSEPLDGGADDLKKIKGIGPQNEARLNALGVYHYRQIAAWTPEEARWVGAYLAFAGRIERENWIGQANTLLSADDGRPV